MMMKKIKYTFALFTILLSIFLIFDGFFDHVLYARYKNDLPDYEGKFVNYLPDGVDKKIYKSAYQDSLTLTFYNTPFLDRVIEPGDYGIYKVDKYGHRIFPEETIQPEVQRKSLLLLGSSQTFGYHLNAEDTLSVKMQSLLPDYKIDNYSMLGVNLEGNLVDWQKMAEIEKKHYDLVIVVNGFFDHYVECTKNMDFKYLEKMMDKYRLPAFVSILQSVKDKIFEESVVNRGVLCEQPEYQNIAARRVHNRWNQLLAFGQEQGSKTLIFIPPSVWSDNANVENLKPLLSERNRAIYSIINTKVHSKVDDKTIIDLTTAFDGDTQYFLDGSSHFTPEGSALLAKEIAEQIKAREQDTFN